MTIHLNFCMAATAITWIDGAHFEQAPPRRCPTTKRTEYAFANLRCRLAQDLGGEGFGIDCVGGQQTDAKSADRRGYEARGVIENRKLQLLKYSPLRPFSRDPVGRVRRAWHVIY